MKTVVINYRTSESLNSQLLSLQSSEIIAIMPQEYEVGRGGESRVLISVLVIYK